MVPSKTATPLPIQITTPISKDPTMRRTDVDDPTQLDWVSRQRQAVIPFDVINGRPVNPVERIGRSGRGGLRYWGESRAADALVLATDQSDTAWTVMVERRDGHGWALPGGHIDPGESPAAAAQRELKEETGLALDWVSWRTFPARYVPDPRATDEAWMVTNLSWVYIGQLGGELPRVRGCDDAKRAAWVMADDYDALCTYLRQAYRGKVFSAHVEMLAEALDQVSHLAF